MHRFTRIEKLHITSRSVSSEMLAVSSRTAYLSVFKSTVCCTLYVSNNCTEKKKQVLLGPANEEAAHHQNEQPPVAKTKGEATLITVVWNVPPSCRNHRLWCGGSFGARNSLIISV